MKTFFYIIFSLFAIQLSGQTIHYVNPLAQGQNNGSSWANAFASLHEGLSAAQPGDAIWVAQSIYRPTAGTDKTIRFELKSNVKMYGGFVGGEPMLAERNWEVHPSIIDGDIGTLQYAETHSNLLFVGKLIK